MMERIGETRSNDLPTALVASSPRLGLWIFLSTVVMLFASFLSAYLIRSAAPDFSVGPLPGLLWVNTIVLLASSMLLEGGRRTAGETRSAARWVAGAFVLGLLFLGGQLLVWGQLRDMGLFIPSSPHAAFFYLLTGVHGLHLVSGLGVLAWLWSRTRRLTPEDPDLRESFSIGATYWHFLGGLWLVLFFVLFT